jgi:hypothetical protein
MNMLLPICIEWRILGVSGWERVITGRMMKKQMFQRIREFLKNLKSFKLEQRGNTPTLLQKQRNTKYIHHFIKEKKI